MALAFGQGDVSQAFAEKIGRIYGSSTFGKSSARAPEARVHRCAKQHGLALNCDVTWLDVPTKSDDGSLQICPWPILLPKDVMVALIEAGHLEMLTGTLQERRRYWARALTDFSGHDSLDADTTAPLNLYGDESTVFRSSCMCLHWEPVLNRFRGDSMLSRFLIAIIPSERYWIAPLLYVSLISFGCTAASFVYLVLAVASEVNRVNRTLQAVIQYVVDSLNEVARDGLQISSRQQDANANWVGLSSFHFIWWRATFYCSGSILIFSVNIGS